MAQFAMPAATELAAFSSSQERLSWVEKRVSGLLEQARSSVTEVHWRDAGIEKLRFAELLPQGGVIEFTCMAHAAEVRRPSSGEYEPRRGGIALHRRIVVSKKPA
jgi:hypothetical protein